MKKSYLARVQSANLPTHTIAFTYQDGGPPFCGGMFRITYVRPSTPADEAAFPIPDNSDEVCTLCDQEIPWK